MDSTIISIDQTELESQPAETNGTKSSEYGMSYPKVAEELFKAEMAEYAAGLLSEKPQKISRQRVEQIANRALKKIAKIAGDELKVYL